MNEINTFFKQIDEIRAARDAECLYQEENRNNLVSYEFLMTVHFSDNCIFSVYIVVIEKGMKSI